jgi:hypothetical protein
MKVIRSYNVERWTGVRRLVRDVPHLRAMQQSHRVDTWEALVDLKSAAQRAKLTQAEKDALNSVARYGYCRSWLSDQFMGACKKIAAVFQSDGYGPMEIMRY